MSPSKEAKKLGFKSLIQVAFIFGCTTKCLEKYYKGNHDKFLIILHGCLWYLNKKDEGHE